MTICEVQWDVLVKRSEECDILCLASNINALVHFVSFGNIMCYRS